MSVQIIHIKNCEKYCTLAEFIRGILKKSMMYNSRMIFEVLMGVLKKIENKHPLIVIWWLLLDTL